MNIVDKYILENFDQNIIVVTITEGHAPSLKFFEVYSIGDSILIEKEWLRLFFKAFGSTWARIDYLHKYDISLINKNVYGLNGITYDYKNDFISKGRYNGNYSDIYRATTK